MKMRVKTKMKEVERHQVVVAVADKHFHVLVEAHPVPEVLWNMEVEPMDVTKRTAGWLSPPSPSTPSMPPSPSPPLYPVGRELPATRQTLFPPRGAGHPSGVYRRRY